MYKLVDVSEWQGSIDWGKVKKSGIDYAIIRVGGRYGKSGIIYSDDTAFDNINKALDNNIRIGFYFYTQAISESEAIDEANWILNRYDKYLKRIELPIYIDTEYLAEGRHTNLNKNERTKIIKAFCKTIQSAGYTAGVYSNIAWLNEKLDMSILSGYSVWVAQYYSRCEYKGFYDIWQYSSTGKVDGISGKVDMNILYTNFTHDYPDDIKIKAVDVIFGKYGDDKERVDNLGKDYNKVQDLVNEIYGRLK